MCLRGILLAEMTFDNTKNNLRTSCLHLLECHTACNWASPPLTAVNYFLFTNVLVYHLRLLILKMTEMMSFHRTIVLTLGNYISEEFQTKTRHSLLKSLKQILYRKLQNCYVPKMVITGHEERLGGVSVSSELPSLIVKVLLVYRCWCKGILSLICVKNAQHIDNNTSRA